MFRSRWQILRSNRSGSFFPCREIVLACRHGEMDGGGITLVGASMRCCHQNNSHLHFGPFNILVKCSRSLGVTLNFDSPLDQKDHVDEAGVNQASAEELRYTRNISVATFSHGSESETAHFPPNCALRTAYFVLHCVLLVRPWALPGFHNRIVRDTDLWQSSVRLGP